MKKVAIVLCALMLLTSVFSLTVSADELFPVIEENPPVTVKKSSPTVDGVINANEGWSDKALFDYNTAGHFWAHMALTTYGDLYFAYDDDGIYFAGDITEQSVFSHADQNGDMKEYNGNGFVFSTGLDDINIDFATGENEYGWNGDVFIFTVDTLGLFRDNGFLDNSDKTAWYCVGLFEDGTTHVFRSQFNPGEITDQVKAAAVAKSGNSGWTVEAFIPWGIIADDANTAAAGAFTVTEDQLREGGATSYAEVIYMDRFFDDAAGYADTWGRYITVATTTVTGWPGQSSSGTCISAYGLTLVNEEVAAPETDPVDSTADSETGADSETQSGDTTASDSNGVATTQKSGSTTTKPQSSGTKSTGGSSAQTFDAGIAVAIGALAISAIGIGYSKKRR